MIFFLHTLGIIIPTGEKSIFRGVESTKQKRMNMGQPTFQVIQVIQVHGVMDISGTNRTKPGRVGIGNLSLKLHEDIWAWLKNAWLQYVTVYGYYDIL